MSEGVLLAKAYEKNELCGWAEVRHPGLAKEAFMLLDSQGAFKKFQIAGQTRVTTGRKAFLHHIVRQVLGKDTLNYPQKIGDCVSFGAKNGAEYLTCSQIIGKAIAVAQGDAAVFGDIIRAARIKFRPVFPPYYYGTGRNYIGKNQIGRGDGSLGSWMAEAVQKYGTLFADESGVPAYSGQIATAWGDSDGRSDLDKWRPTAEKFLIKSTAQIKSWDDLVTALVNGYPCPTASNIGYNMEPSSDGFHRQTTTWGHQMCFVGVDESGKEPYALILNNWGDCHGHLKDFETNEELPVGVLRVRRADAEKHIRAQETYAYSNFDGFPEQKLDKALFMLI